MEKMKDKLHHGSESKKGESNGSGGTGEVKKEHHGLGETVKEDLHKFHEYNLKEEKKEANDDIWGRGPQ